LFGSAMSRMSSELAVDIAGTKSAAASATLIRNRPFMVPPSFATTLTRGCDPSAFAASAVSTPTATRVSLSLIRPFGHEARLLGRFGDLEVLPDLLLPTLTEQPAAFPRRGPELGENFRLHERVVAELTGNPVEAADAPVQVFVDLPAVIVHAAKHVLHAGQGGKVVRPFVRVGIREHTEGCERSGSHDPGGRRHGDVMS